MRKVAVILLMALFLTGCAREGAEERGVALWVELGTDREIQGIHYEYSADGVSFGSGTVVNADDSPMKAGETVWLQFLPEDFPEGKIPEIFTVQVYVVEEQGQEHGAEYPIHVPADGQGELHFLLEGNETEGYRLQYVG